MDKANKDRIPELGEKPWWLNGKTFYRGHTIRRCPLVWPFFSLRAALPDDVSVHEQSTSSRRREYRRKLFWAALFTRGRF